MSQNPSASLFHLLCGVVLVSGTGVGAGMFSLPVVAAGMWLVPALFCLGAACLMMVLSGLLILETNLHFPVGASFNTIVKQTLGPTWNVLNGLSVAFVMYILTYAYISGGGAIVNHTLQSVFEIELPRVFSSSLFCLVLAFIVWWSTEAVGRLTAILIAAMLVTFALSTGDLLGSLDSAKLLNLEQENQKYLPYILASLPFFLTSFGFHGVVPSLVKYYGKQPRIIVLCITLGSGLALTIYVLWLVANFGSISRSDFAGIIIAGGNMDILVTALGKVSDSQLIANLFNAFANFAVISSFLGVTLGLFDYLADLLGFDDSRLGRFKTALITFMPPLIAGLLFPNGFIYAIGFAGLAATIFGAIVPGMMARAARKQFPQSHFTTPGGSLVIYSVIALGAVVALCHLLAMAGSLPLYPTS